MKKRYLKTLEDVLALNGTDTKIYVESSAGYYKFVKGVLCHFNAYNGVTYFNCALDMEEDVYILEEEPKQEATEEDINKLCWFWNDDENDKRVDVLKEIDKRLHQKFLGNICYFHCRRLSPSEVAELTGYKVEKEI